LIIAARTEEVGRRTWRWDGGFGWGMAKFSFGASKKRRLSPSRQGVVSTGGRSRWGRINNSLVEILSPAHSLAFGGTNEKPPCLTL
jgi:hypothetical protein